MNSRKLFNALSFIAAVVDPAIQTFLRKLRVAQISPRLPPMLQGFRTAPIGGRHSVEYIVACLIPDALTMLVQHIFPPLLVAPSAVFVQRANGTHDMKVRIGNANVLLVGRMNSKVHHHPSAHKVLQQKLPCQSDVLLHGKLVLQGNIEAVGKLRFLSALSFFNRVPKRFAVCVFRRCVGRQKDFRADHAAFSGVVADLAVVFAVQLFPGTIGGRRHSGLSRTALDLGYMKME